MEGVHVGSAPQEALVQNDQEDEVDAGQEAEHHVRQQEGQVEALRGQEGGGLSRGQGWAGGEGGCVLSRGPGSDEGRLDQIPTPHGPTDPGIWGPPPPSPIPALQVLWVSRPPPWLWSFLPSLGMSWSSQLTAQLRSGSLTPVISFSSQRAPR